MGRKTIALRLGWFLLAGAMAAPAAAELAKLDVKGPYVQAVSGMTFPDAVGDFHRTSVMQFKPDGSDVSAGYLGGKAGGEIVATAYSFPSPPAGAPSGQARDRLCGAVAAAVVKSIETSYPGARRLQSNPASLNQNGAAQNGYHALYAMTVPVFMNRKQEAVKSDAYVFCYAGGKWTVEYRFTYPAMAEAGPAIAQFLRDLHWTFTP